MFVEKNKFIFKSTVMNKFFFVLVMQCFMLNGLAQNVGIGIPNPRAKLEVFGGAIFGSDGSGISLQRNWPTIGFNHYFSNGNKYMTTGYAATQNLDMGAGTLNFYMYPSGTVNTPIPAPVTSMTLYNNGNVSILGAYIDASLAVARGTGYSGTAVFAGTTNLSHFNFGIAEDTYIRAGKDGSTVYLNDVTNGNIQMGAGSTKVGINTGPSTPLTSLDINGAVTYRPRMSNVNPTNSNLIIGDRTYIIVNNSDHSTWSRIFTISDGINPGQLLILEGNSLNYGSYSLFLRNLGNVRLSGVNAEISDGSILTLIWNGYLWHQISYAGN